jgi:hypothetical protein
VIAVGDQVGGRAEADPQPPRAIDAMRADPQQPAVELDVDAGGGERRLALGLEAGELRVLAEAEVVEAVVEAGAPSLTSIDPR